MYFSSVEELFHMDGHGVYVWAVFGIAALIIVSQVLAPIIRVNKFWQREQALYKRLSAAPAGQQVEGK
jgi:heme exporter protein CcmD